MSDGGAPLSLEDERAIESVLLRYATAADTRDTALLASCFTADVRADYGEQIGRFEGRDALVGHLSAMLAACGLTIHYISNVVASASGGEARARCYTQAVVHLSGLETPLRTAGIYDDRLCRADDGWRIAERVYTAAA